MELKDVILSTLAEMEDSSDKVISTKNDFKVKEKSSFVEVKKQDVKPETPSYQEEEQSSDNELMFLNSMRERLLVLFEGFQSPNNANIEAKIDLTLNFLEYSLATIDERVERLKKETKSEPI